METPISQDVLRCKLCSKPFDKEVSLKRHSYYCRGKRGTIRRARLRSCEACIKDKTRCDNVRPSCARCAVRRIPCAYPKEKGSLKGGDQISLNQTSYLANTRDTGVSDAVLTTTSSYAATQPFDKSAVDLLDFSSTDTSFMMSDWSTQFNNSSLTETDSWSPLITSLPQPERSDGRKIPLPIPHHLEGHTIFRMPTYHFRSFAQSKSMTGRTSPSVMLMTHMLTSFPRTMYNPGSLPPFIHPYSIGHNVHNLYRGFESLTTCVMLMQMVSSDAPGRKSLFWKNVRLECERIQAEMPRLDKWDLLSAMQALTVYILVRLQEGETPDNNHDVLLLSTLWIAACALNECVNFRLCTARTGLHCGSSQHEWIFEESRRRLALVYQILKMMYSLDPATTCAETDGFLLAPLPGRRQLWEAPDAQAWVGEKSRDGMFPSVFGVLTGGRMVKLQEQQLILPDDVYFPLGSEEAESAANWQEWCAGMDGFGTLVTLAVTL